MRFSFRLKKNELSSLTNQNSWIKIFKSCKQPIRSSITCRSTLPSTSNPASVHKYTNFNMDGQNLTIKNRFSIGERWCNCKESTNRYTRNIWCGLIVEIHLGQSHENEIGRNSIHIKADLK